MPNKIVNTNREVQDNPAKQLLGLMCGDTIENQEADGQKQLVESEVLPVNFNYPDNGKEILEKFGVKFLGKVDGDPMFQHVKLPTGWKIKPTDHSMWSKLYDQYDRIRASIFYKAAFYDRSAHIGLERAVKLINKSYEDDLYLNNKNQYSIEVHGQTVFEGPIIQGKKGYDPDSDTKARTPAEKYLKDHWPVYEQYDVYW